MEKGIMEIRTRKYPSWKYQQCTGDMKANKRLERKAGTGMERAVYVFLRRQKFDINKGIVVVVVSNHRSDTYLNINVFCH